MTGKILFVRPARRAMILLKAHVKGYTKKDGTYVRPHQDKRVANAGQMDLFSGNHAFSIADKMPGRDHTPPIQSREGSLVVENLKAGLNEKQSAQLDGLLETLNGSGPIIKSRYADLRSSLSRMFENAADQEMAKPYLAIDHSNRPEWFSEIYYSNTLVSLKKCKRIAEKHAGDPLADRALAFLSAWEPVLAKLDARKADVTTSAALREEKKVVERKAKEAIPPTKLSQIVGEACDARKPAIAEDYRDWIGAVWRNFLKNYGPKMKLAKDQAYPKSWITNVKPVMDRTAEGYQINSDKLNRAADDYAHAVVESWKGKIMSKLSDLDEPEVDRLDGTSFRLYGKKGGSDVRIEQNMIINVSVLGTRYAQFPARIYVDGKFMSELAYKKRFHAGGNG